MSHDPSPSKPTNDSPAAEIQAPEVEASEVPSETTEQAEVIEIVIDTIEADGSSDEVVIVEVTGDLDIPAEITEDDLATADTDRPADEVVIVDLSHDPLINAEATEADRPVETPGSPEITDAPATNLTDTDPTDDVEVTGAERIDAALEVIETDTEAAVTEPSEPLAEPSSDSSEQTDDLVETVTEPSEDGPEPPPAPASPRSAAARRPPTMPRRPPRSATTDDETVPQTIVRLLREQVWPVLKLLLVTVLRLAVRGLEALINQLEATPQPSASGQIATPSPSSSGTPRPEVVSPSRKRGPLTAAIVGIAIVAIVLLPGFFSKPPEPISDVAVVPSPTPISEVPDEVIITPDVPAPEPNPIAPVPEVPDLSEATEPTVPTDGSDAAAPIAVEPTPKPSPELPPPPPVELTPQQKLLATIKDDLDSLSNAYSQSLIQAIKVNFRLSRLTVVMSQDWYNLTPDQQSTLANELLERSQQLDFSRLEITDSQAVLLARNPVVGIEMIILRRSASTIAT